MAKQDIRNGQAEYGIRHVMEEEMREAEEGVFAPKAARTVRKAAAAPETKMEAAPENKAVSAATAPVRPARKGK